ncbi:MAG: hypothetical protein WAN94_26535 [Pseudolabrys sp.]
MPIDTAPIEALPLPRPKPSLHYVTGDNPAALISAFRHQHGEGSVAISPALTRVAQEQANAMAVRDLLDHNALATSMFGTLRPSALVVLRFPQYGWPPAAVGVSHNTTRTNAPVIRYGAARPFAKKRVSQKILDPRAPSAHDPCTEFHQFGEVALARPASLSADRSARSKG